VGVGLSGIIPEEYVQGNLFHQPSKLNNEKLIKTFDTLNLKLEKPLFLLVWWERGLMNGTHQKERSPRYTTQWRELLKINAKG